MATTSRGAPRPEAPALPGLSPSPGIWDELVERDGAARPAAEMLFERLRAMGLSELRARQDRAELEILAMGITFTVYSDGRGIDRAWPYDVIPRVIAAEEWRDVAAGLRQRLDALNRFIDDVYNERRVIADGVFPEELLADSVNLRPQCMGVRPRFGAWAHVCGSDLVRGADGRMYVLEDNLRVPSGVSYMLENRLMSKRAFGDLFQRQSVLPVDDYPERLARLLRSLAPEDRPSPSVVVLTPGVYNSAYFEHCFLARRMGVPLVEGRDLFVDDRDRVFMRTLGGRERVDVVYRRVDDAFLDPEALRPDSVLGVPGLMRAWRAGTVGIANAPGAGVADDVRPRAPPLAPEPRPDGREARQRERRPRPGDRRPARHRPSCGGRPGRSRPTRATGSPSRSSRSPPCRRSAETGSGTATSTCGRSSSAARTST